MHTLEVSLENRAYPICIGTGLLKQHELITRHLPQKRAAVITDSVVAPLYLPMLTATLHRAGIEITPIIVPAGEQHKDWQSLNSIFDALLAARCERKTALIALGGGVVGDLTGFAAATYLRGVPFIQIPTTLLALVDSSVGGKTAINHPRGKNMIGAFYQPQAVIADTSTLDTLPQRELSAGLAEVIKYGLIRDLPFFDWLEDHMDELNARAPAAMAYAVQRSCENKAAVVAADEREETGERALLNLGHTFGHAIESGMGYGNWLHGEAVAAGMVVAARLSQLMGMIRGDDVGRIVALLERAGLPVTIPDLGLEKYLQLMGHDKKVEGGKLRFILMHEMGRAFLTADVQRDALIDALKMSIARD
jgi:3-dehydroquinate synthase